MCGHPRDWSACRGASGRSWPPVGPAGPSRRAFERDAAQGGEVGGPPGDEDPRVERMKEERSKGIETEREREG